MTTWAIIIVQREAESTCGYTTFHTVQIRVWISVRIMAWITIQITVRITTLNLLWDMYQHSAEWYHQSDTCLNSTILKFSVYKHIAMPILYNVIPPHVLALQCYAAVWFVCLNVARLSSWPKGVWVFQAWWEVSSGILYYKVDTIYFGRVLGVQLLKFVLSKHTVFRASIEFATQNQWNNNVG